MARRRPQEEEIVELLAVGPFGGLDTTTASRFVAPTNFVDGENFVPNREYGGYSTVRGRLAALAATLPSQPYGIFCMNRTGQPDTYIFAVNAAGAGALYAGQLGGTATALTLPSGVTLTQSQQTFFAAAGKWVFLTNGIDTPLKIDSSLVVTRWGIAKPAAAPTVAIGAAGALLGTYYYCVTFGNANQESSQGIVSTSITPVNQQVNLTNIPISSDSQVTQRNIYRIGGALGQWRLVATINDNTSTTYTDNLADANVTGQSLTVFRDAPPAFKYITSHLGRIWGFGTQSDNSQIWWSNYGEPWGFNSLTNVQEVGENTFDDGAVALASTGSVLVALKKRSVHGIWGQTDADFQTYPITKGLGCDSARSVAAGYGTVYWSSSQGVYYFSGSTFDAVQNNISDGNFQKSNIKATLDALSATDKASTVGFIYDRGYYISFPTLNKTYLYDLRQQAWYRLGWATNMVYYGFEDAVPVVAANLQTVGQIDEWFVADNDFGGNITSYMTTRTTDAELMQSQKRARYFIVLAPIQVGTITYTVNVNPGTGSTPFSGTINLSTGSPRHQVDVPDYMEGTEFNFTLQVVSSVNIVLERAALYGMIVREFIEEGG